MYHESAADSRLASFDTTKMRGSFFVLSAAFLFAAANAVAKALYMRGHTLVSLRLVGHTQLACIRSTSRAYASFRLGHTRC